jgi:hypothetical protein
VPRWNQAPKNPLNPAPTLARTLELLESIYQCPWVPVSVGSSVRGFQCPQIPAFQCPDVPRVPVSRRPRFPPTGSPKTWVLGPKRGKNGHKGGGVHRRESVRKVHKWVGMGLWGLEIPCPPISTESPRMRTIDNGKFTKSKLSTGATSAYEHSQKGPLRNLCTLQPQKAVGGCSK